MAFYEHACPLREELICCGSVRGKGEDPQTGGAGRRAEARLLFALCEAEGGGYRAKNGDSPGGQVVAAPKYCIFIVHVPLVNEGIDYETW